MIRKPFLIISLLTISLLWFGCTAAQQRVEIHGTDVEEHGHTYRYIQSFGKQNYHAAMEYDARAGMIEIKFMNRDENLVELLKERRIKALLTFPEGAQREFYFYNLQESEFYFLSYDYSERNAGRIKANDTIYARKDWLRNLSSFKLTVWVPLEDKSYFLNYHYEKKDKM